ncbi:MAG: hypothetical protein KC910_04750 [Candidatus Eremiobacteraeota bacterium]|nr:hypothetical protein [Candidatus Eremiobacteraeota bacterium]
MRRSQNLLWLLGLMSLLAVSFWATAQTKPPASFHILLGEDYPPTLPEDLPVRLASFDQHGPVLELRLDGSPYRAARFRIEYGQGEPQAWTVNIGDSVSNNGYGGDGATQSRDCELQVAGDTLAIYGSDAMDGQERLLKKVPDFAQASRTIEFVVANEYLSWTSRRGTDSMTSPYLFALAGQSDQEGEPNQTIYAAFNRTISGGGRTGSGVTAVTVELLTHLEAGGR